MLLKISPWGFKHLKLCRKGVGKGRHYHVSTVLKIKSLCVCLQQIQEDLNKQLFDNLVSFLRRSHSVFQEKTTKWTCRMKSREIPTAALVLGSFFTIYFFYVHLLKADKEIEEKYVADFQQLL